MKAGQMALFACCALLVAAARPTQLTAAPPARWILAYAGSAARVRSTYTVDDFLRLATVVDSTGEPQFWLTSGAICLQLFAPSGRVFEPDLAGPHANGADWAAYLDSLFAGGGILKRLDSAVAIASTTLGRPPAPYQVSVMIPYPGERDAGVEFRGRTYQLWSPSERGDLALAYMAEVKRRFETEHLAHLTLDGFYWLHERVPPGDSGLVAAVSHAVHEGHLRLLWIPYFDAEGWDHWRALGFDEAWLQPNYFFDRGVPATRLDSATARAERAGLGMEVEFDARVIGNPQFTDRLGPYLAALLMNRELRERSIAIYDGEGALADLSRSTLLPVQVRYRSLWMALLR